MGILYALWYEHLWNSWNIVHYKYGRLGEWAYQKENVTEKQEETDIYVQTGICIMQQKGFKKGKNINVFVCMNVKSLCFLVCSFVRVCV